MRYRITEFILVTYDTVHKMKRIDLIDVYCNMIQ
jgi:hypothetical protein